MAKQPEHAGFYRHQTETENGEMSYLAHTADERRGHAWYPLVIQASEGLEMLACSIGI